MKMTFSCKGDLDGTEYREIPRMRLNTSAPTALRLYGRILCKDVLSKGAKA